MKTQSQPWLGNPKVESIFILSPALFPVAVIFLFRDYFISHDVSTWWWVILVLCVDVSHVYSTLFRLYWDKQTFTTYKHLLIIIPIGALVVGFSLHYYDAMLFWRILAYIAVFHFVRQQYGFMRLYSRFEPRERWSRLIDSVAIYSATLYPLLYWHIHATDKLAWFVKGDFISLQLSPYSNYFFTLYVIIVLIYTGKELRASFLRRSFNVPKNLIVAGTFASWYVGIVLFQGDLIFTLLNVVAHGIPYMALIWLHGQKKNEEFSFNLKGLGIFGGVLIVLAYIEEYFWDRFVWKEHVDIFPGLSSVFIEGPALLSLIVAVLVLPQVTHYILDGFIWRFGKDAKTSPQ